MTESTQKPNRLINESSPYLLQHAYNPVDWYPWGSEAFEKARLENKPVFLSIGYSTCHWCHVMEKESFENDFIAGSMNDTFVSVKVDREERPDIDSIYMNVCQMLTGAGGWPLSIILTPDRKPFYAATYIPPKTMWGRIGMDELIPRIAKIWNENKMTLVQTSLDITGKINSDKYEQSGIMPDKSIFKTAYEKLSSGFDEINGGFGRAPKFPMPHNISFLINYGILEKQPRALEMASKTLGAMRMGGIFDQAGFGFHRYSTDINWLVPHFEKMLYDQALLVVAFSDAYKATGEEILRRTACENIEYVLRDLKSPEGAFYSAEDADSEGIEGKFYLWMQDELDIPGLDSDFISQVWSIKKEGNFHDETGHSLAGSNIPHLARPVNEIAESLGLGTEEFNEKLELARNIIFREREKRIRPLRDDKILADWNGLMIAALARAAGVFGAKEYADAAEKAYGFIKSKMINKDGRVSHRYRNGDVLEISTLDDYAFLVWGLTELYDTTYKLQYLEDAIKLTNKMIDDFADSDNGGFYLAPGSGEELISKPKELYDGAIPSGNSIALRNLVYLYKITGNSKYSEMAGKSVKLFTGAVTQYPQGYTAFLSALARLLYPSTEIVVCGGGESAGTHEVIELLNAVKKPNTYIILKTPENGEELARIAPYTSSMKLTGGKATVYVCTDFACSQPIDDIDELRDMLT